MKTICKLVQEIAQLNKRIDDLRYVALVVSVFQPGETYYTDDTVYVFHRDITHAITDHPDISNNYHTAYAYHLDATIISRDEPVPDGYIQISDWFLRDDNTSIDSLIDHAALLLTESKFALMMYTSDTI